MARKTSRRVRLTPTQGHILWMLESAGAHSVATVVNAVWDLDREREPAGVLVELEEAARTLARMGFVSLHAHGDVLPLPRNMAEASLSLSTAMAWESQRGSWTLLDESTEIAFVLTPEGREQLTR